MRVNKPTVEERQRDWVELLEEESTLMLRKGADYTAGKKDSDAYANFRIVADLLKGAPITPYTVAMVYALKHVFSLITFAKTGRQESGEGLRGRHMDVRNYFFILNELVPDHVNFFESATLGSLVRKAELLMDTSIAVANAKFDELATEEFPTVITEDTTTGEAQYWDETRLLWRPISDLDAKKEVNNTTQNSVDISSIA